MSEIKKTAKSRGNGVFMSMLGVSILVLTIAFSLILIKSKSSGVHNNAAPDNTEQTSKKNEKPSTPTNDEAKKDKTAKSTSDSKPDTTSNEKKKKNSKRSQGKSMSGQGKKSRVKFGAKPSGPPYVKILPVTPEANVIEFTATGRIATKTVRNLNSEVAGEIVRLHPHLEAGELVKKGALIAKIDPNSLSRQLKSANARLTQAQATLDQERAKAKQAKIDLTRAGIKKPSALALRKPQLASAEASLTSIRAEIKDLKKDIEKVTVTSPINGMVLTKKANLGDQVGASTPIVELIDIDMLTVDIPLTKQELLWLGTDAIKKHRAVKVQLDEEPQHHWMAKLERLSPQVNAETQSLSVIANLATPYKVVPLDDTLLRIGSAVTVTLKGRGMPNSQWVNTNSIEQGKYLWTVDGDKKLHRTEVSIVKTREPRNGNEEKQSLIVFTERVTNYIPRLQSSFTKGLEVSTTKPSETDDKSKDSKQKLTPKSDTSEAE